MLRTFWLAPGPAPAAPLLLAIHGLGMTGRDMAAFTGLDSRGPAAGFTTVFPDGWPSGDARARPPAPAALLWFQGTGDPAVPYGGGVLGPRGVLGRLADR